MMTILKRSFTYVDRMTPLGIPDENGIYPTVVPHDSMKVLSTDDVPAGSMQVCLELKGIVKKRLQSM